MWYWNYLTTILKESRIAQLSSKSERTLKFGFSENATKFEKILVVLLTRASCSVRETAYLSKSRRRFFKTNVDKSYYTNFNAGMQQAGGGRGGRAPPQILADQKVCRITTGPPGFFTLGASL